MRSWWHGLRGGRTEGISPWLGLSLGGLYLAAVGGVGLAGIHFERAAVSKQRLADAKQWTYWVARHLASVQAEGEEAVGHEVRQVAHEPGVTFCEIVSPEGVVVAHSEAGRIGRAAAKVVTSEADAAGVQVGTMGDRPRELVLVGRLVLPLGRTRNSELRVGLALSRQAWPQSDIAFWSGYVLLAVLGLYLLVYRLLRRSVEPLAVIRNRLLGCVQPTPERLLALRLNDSYDQISTSWNGLIEFVGEMQERLRGVPVMTDVTTAMDGYRSEQLTQVLMQIPFGVLMVDERGEITFANRAAGGMLGAPGEPLEGQPVSKVFDERLRMALLSSCKSSRPTQGASGRWIDQDFERTNHRVTLRFWSSPSDTRDNEYTLFVQDVTQAKEAEHARDHFLYHVTHELRTPLTNIRAYAETLSQGVIDDEQTTRECHNVIMGETGRLSRLVEDLLSVSQLEVGTAKLDTREVQPAEVLRKVVQDNQGSADAKNIDLVLRLPAKLPKLLGDRDRLAVVFNNLIGNAVKYTPAGGRIEVSCAAEQQRVEIAIADTGIGIAPKDQEKVFEKFYRVDDERVAAQPGSGLGLAIARETVRVHGGTLTLTSTLGKGSTFVVGLPALGIDESRTDRRVSVAAVKEQA